MASLSDEDFRNLLESSVQEFSKPKAPRVFNGNHCTCGGIVDLQTGVCYRCHHQHQVDLEAGPRNAQPKVPEPQVSESERLSQFASFCGQSCPSCFHGTLNEQGDCDFCEYHSIDYYGPY